MKIKKSKKNINEKKTSRHTITTVNTASTESEWIKMSSCKMLSKNSKKSFVVEFFLSHCLSKESIKVSNGKYGLSDSSLFKYTNIFGTCHFFFWKNSECISAGENENTKNLCKLNSYTLPNFHFEILPNFITIMKCIYHRSNYIIWLAPKELIRYAQNSDILRYY